MKAGKNLRLAPFHRVRRGGFQMAAEGAGRLDVASAAPAKVADSF